MRMRRNYIEENSKTWKSEEEEILKKAVEEENKRERLRRAAEKKESAKEKGIQRKITDTKREEEGRI